MTASLVATEWLAERLDAPDIRVVDASWYLPTLARDAEAEYAAAHIPGAVYFDIDDISDRDDPLPHMLPSPATFAARVAELGLGDGVRIVIYDANNYSASARAWWMFRVFGHDDVAVLDGGLAKWRSEGRPLDDHRVEPRQAQFTAKMNANLVRYFNQLMESSQNSSEQVVDARAAGRFAGTDPEPRPGLRSGHIPNSLNLPHLELIAEDGTLRPTGEIRDRFLQAGVDLARPVVTTCGSGVTASTLALALHRLGVHDAAVYDGSWSEWGARDDTPVAR
jgi:thiosulfate/3-mercaptopyruvate sulfurtransferase